MTDREIAKAVEKMKQEDAKHPLEGRLGDLFDRGVIDAQGRVFSESLSVVEDLLREKGLNEVSASHRGNIPGGAVRLHEKVADPREAEGPYGKILKIIKKARSHEGLWKALQTAGYCMTPDTPGKKKTG